MDCEVDAEADAIAAADSRTASAQGLYLSFILCSVGNCDGKLLTYCSLPGKERVIDGFLFKTKTDKMS